ncbi:MAG TPA: TA system VapC family ribonuclease toxin [Bryobacteraceae bacterium]|nr:TA system VapC family ribonuclease toxin [Bryobacteraceae bacterium]
MIAVDTNLLVYAHRRDSEWHAASGRVVTRLAESASPWAIPWPCIHEFLGVVTHPRVYRPASLLKEAVQQVEIWMESPSLRFIGELAGHWAELRPMLMAGKISGKAVHDARIAAICREHGIRELWTADRDFSRMVGITVRNPLTGASSS